jgi:DNA gyrase subunit A
MDLKDGDYIEHLFITTTHHFILFVTSRGKIYRLKVHELPLGARQSKGRAIVNLLPLAQDEEIKAVIATKDYSDAKYLAFATRNGLVKKTAFKLFNTPLKADGIIAISLQDDDELVAIKPTDGDDDLILVSSEGKAVRFHESDVRPTGRNTQGVAGMRLPRAHHVVGMATARDDADLFCVTSGGYGKRTPISSYPVHRRGGQGVITIKDAPDRGDLVAIAFVRDNHELILVSQDGVVIRIPVVSVRTMGRNTMGVRVMNLRGEDRVASMARVVRDATTTLDDDAVPADGLAAPVVGEGIGVEDVDSASEADFEETAGFDEDFDDDLEEDADGEDVPDEE